MRLTVTPGAPLRGAIRVAADKSISHRAVIFASIADGVTRLRNLSQGADVRATVEAFRAMGVRIDAAAAGDVTIRGVGLRGLRQPPGAFDMGNSGTALRLLAGVLCAQPWPSKLSGDESLNARPMARIIAPLTQMGARIASESGDGCPPLLIAPAPRLRGIDYALPVASAQVKSALLLAGLYADGATTVTAPAATRDHTERMLAAFGAPVEVANGDGDGARVGVRGGGELRAGDGDGDGEWVLEVPADLSAAAFFLVAATVIDGSEIQLRGVGVNPTRSGILSILRRMGADLELRAERVVSGEPVADISARAAKLRGIDIGAAEVALAIDEIPALAVAAACAEGTTTIRGAAELRVKESDRLSAVAAGLTALGIAVEEHPDGLTIHGRGEGRGRGPFRGGVGRGPFRGGSVDSRGDHRIAMAFAVAGGAATGAVTVRDCANIGTSFPGFCQAARAAGLAVQVGDE
ncbi:MAG: 3-phosphoshikimate 1-carboxyvinyltransferase [Gammaproteobacteria bacterium]|nr:3-phosphoshikimate 1-carboxyvinyltransferase [Gammaproteobacteria bacterium]